MVTLIQLDFSMKKIITTFLLFLLFMPFVGAKAPEFSTSEKLTQINFHFWEQFNDECLSNYIKLAVQNNHSAKQAFYTVEEYRQNVKNELGKEFPTLSVGANYLGIKVPNVGDYQLQKNGFILPFFANWELDLLLKNYDKYKSAKKNFEASEEAEKAVYIALASDVATTYFNILNYDKNISLQEKIVKNQEDILRRSKRQFDAGTISKTVLNDNYKAFQNAKNELIKLKSALATNLTRLALLIGESPNNINNLKRTKYDDFKGVVKIPSQLSSEVIFARPDVIESERKLEAAKIDVRVAKKELFPKFNVTGVWAFNTIAQGAFFSWESSLAYLLAGATQDLFMGGRKIANIRFYKARYEKLFEAYKQTDLNALKEVNDALLLLKNDNEILKNTENQLLAEKENYNSTSKRLANGVISKIIELDGQNNLYSKEKSFANAKTINFIDYITLYKTVGGNL